MYDNNITALKILCVVLAVLGAVFLANRAWSQDGGGEHPPFGDFHKPWSLDTANRESVRKYFMFVNGKYYLPFSEIELPLADNICKTKLGEGSYAIGVTEDALVNCVQKISLVPNMAPVVCNNLGSEFDRLEGDVIWCKPRKEEQEKQPPIPRGGRSALL